jgi:hypothetical protein
MPGEFSIWAFLALLGVLLASGFVFWIHVQRWTVHHRAVAMAEWAARHRFKLYRAVEGRTPPGVPIPLATLTLPPPTVCVAMVAKRTVVLQMDTPATPAEAMTGMVGKNCRWNVLVREIEAEWPTTALRPLEQAVSLIDLFNLPSLPALFTGDRFTIHGESASAARVMMKSMLRALLPRDVGLVLAGRRLVLDFSHRPFDEIELTRMVGLAEQLAAHLPVPKSAKR